MPDTDPATNWRKTPDQVRGDVARGNDEKEREDAN